MGGEPPSSLSWGNPLTTNRSIGIKTEDKYKRIGMDFKKYLNELDLSNIDSFYCDVRIEDLQSTLIGYKNKEFERFEETPSVGAFLRVYNNDHWFYKATTNLQSIPDQLQELVAESKKFEGTSKDFFKAVPKGYQEKILFEKQNPRKIETSKKKALCESYLDQLTIFPQVKESLIYYTDRYHLKGFKSNRGTSYLYDFAQYGMYFQWVLKEDDQLFTDGLNKWAMNFDDCMNFQNEIKNHLDASLPHLNAKPIDPGKYTVVMNSDVVGVFAHESFGHKSEADAMLGDEDALKQWEIGTQVASDIVNIVDEGTQPNNSGYVPFDDEGMPAQKNYLIKNGRLSGRLHSLYTAYTFDEKPTSNARAINFEFDPIVRMTNTYIEPGEQSFDEMISQIKEGVYVSDYRHGSGLSTFTIAPTRSYRIINGKIAEPVRVSVISGTVFETLKNISGLSNGFEIKSSAFGGCGKNEQMPLRVGDGGPSMVVENMQVG